MRHSKNIAKAFFTAPFIPAFIAVLSTPAFYNQGPVTFFGFLVISYVISGMVILLAALPAYLLLSHINKVNFVSILSAGIVIGLAVGIVFPMPANPDLSNVFAMGGMGMITAFGFWLVWRRG